MKKIKVDVLSAFALAGAIQVAGSAKEPNSIEVEEKLAKNLLRRGKVKLSEGAAFSAADDEDETEGTTRRAKKPAAVTAAAG